LPDTIVFVIDTIYESNNIDMDANSDGRYSREIIESVRQNMLSKGLLEVDNSDATAKPDLLVLIKSMTVRQISRYLHYPNYYDPIWGWSGAYYFPPTIYTHTSNNGLLNIDLLDVVNSAKEESDTINLKPVWKGVFEGIVGPTHEEYTDRALDAVDAIFVYDNAFKN
jgi:hypothetical protein